jgi:hypothetical protein
VACSFLAGGSFETWQLKSKRLWFSQASLDKILLEEYVGYDDEPEHGL